MTINIREILPTIQIASTTCRLLIGQYLKEGQDVLTTLTKMWVSLFPEVNIIQSKQDDLAESSVFSHAYGCEL